MDCTDKNKLFVLAILLVLLASWFIGNFLYVMVKSTSGLDSPVISTEDIGERISGEDDSNLFRILLTIFIIILIIMLSVTIIGILFESDMALLTQISVVILVVLVSTTIFAIRLDDDNSTTEAEDSIYRDFDIPTGKDIFDKTRSYGNIILPIILISISLLIITELRRSSKGEIDVDEFFEIDEEEKKIRSKDDISSEFENIRNELKADKGVRNAIIKAYKNMMNIFEKEGIKFDPSMTSREFMNYAMTNFDVSDETISDITNLFEEARYSSHELDEPYREQAFKDLKKLEEELKG